MIYNKESDPIPMLDKAKKPIMVESQVWACVKCGNKRGWGSDEKEYYSTSEFAALLRISTGTVLRWLNKNLVEHIHLPGCIRIPISEYERIRREGIPKIHEEKSDLAPIDVV